MPLIPQRASFPFTAGQEQGVAPELIDPPMLVRAHNVIYNRMGELTKRRGWRAFDDDTQTGGTLPYGDRLLVRDNELVRVGEQRTINWEDPAREQSRIYTRTVGETREETSPRPWMPKGRVPRFNVSRELEIAHTIPGERVGTWDCAFAGDALSGDVGERGVLCTIWQYEGITASGSPEERVDWATVDIATGSLIAQGTLALNCSSDRLIRVVAAKGSDSLWYFHAFWGQGEFGGAEGDVNLKHATMPAYRPWSWSVPDVLTSDASGYDVCVSNPSSVNGFSPFERRLFLVIATTGGVVRCNMYRPGTLGALVLGSFATITTTPIRTGHLHCCCEPNGQHVGVFISVIAASENRLIQFNASAGPAGIVTYYSGATIDNLGPGIHGEQIGWTGTSVDANSVLRYDNWIATWKGVADTPINTRIQFFRAQVGGGFSLPGSTLQVHYATHWSRLFSYRGDPYHVTLKGISVDAVVAEILSWNYQSGSGGDPPPHIQMKHARFGGGELSFTAGFANTRELPYCKGRNSVAESWYDPGRFFTVVPIVSTDGLEHKLALFSISASDYDAQQYSGAELNRSLTIACGVPWLYDGDRGHELGFSHRPQSSAGEIVAASVAAGPPYLSAATYYVAMCFEAIDSQGNISRSAPSKTGAIVVGANSNLSVTFASLGPTSHRNVRPVVYVSSDGGINYYRSKQILVNSATEISDTTTNLDPAKLFVAGVPTLYTDQRIMSNAPLMAARFACEWQGRVWLMNDSWVWPSREVIYGEEPSFNESMQFRIPSNGTGMGSLDDRLILFTRDRIYWIAGDGPTDTGEGGSFTQPQRAASDFGCIDARSIVRCEKGLLFQSRRGIELLGRGLETTLISGGIDQLKFYEVIASSLDPKNQIVRFVMVSPTVVKTYTVACWHVAYDIWTTHDVPRMVAGVGTNVPFGLVHALSRNWMTINDAAGQSTPIEALAMELEATDASFGTYVDGALTASAGYWYSVIVQTANVKMDGLLGFVRVWRAYVKTKGQSSHTGIRIMSVVDGSGVADRYWTTAAEIAAGLVDGSSTNRMFQIHLDKQQCSSVGLYITDCQETGIAPPAVAEVNTFLTFVGFGVEFGQKPGTGRGSEGSKK